MPGEVVDRRHVGLLLLATLHLIRPAAIALAGGREALGGEEGLAVGVGDGGIPAGGVAGDLAALVDDEAKGVAFADVEGDGRLDAFRIAAVKLRLPHHLVAVADEEADAIGLWVHVGFGDAARDCDLAVAGTGEAADARGVLAGVLPVLAHAGPVGAGPVGRAVPRVVAVGQESVGWIRRRADSEGPVGQAHARRLGLGLAFVDEGALDEEKAEFGQPARLLPQDESVGQLR